MAMRSKLNSILGRYATQRINASGSRQGLGLLNIRLGISRLLDRRVPFRYKAAALGIGIAITAAIIALELPFETVVAALLNLLGFGLDALVDGAEIVVGPVLFAALAMPTLTRKLPLDLIIDSKVIPPLNGPS